MNKLKHAQHLRKTPRSGGRNLAVCRVMFCSGCTLAVWLAAWADELPFYKAGCEPTEPAPASSVSSASGASAPLDSRAAQSATSEAVAFNSDGVPGLMMIVR